MVDPHLVQLYQDEIKESRGVFRIDETVSKGMKESIMHKISCHQSVTYP